MRCVFVLQRHVWTYNVCLHQYERQIFCERETHRGLFLCVSCGYTWTLTKQIEKRRLSVAEPQQIVDLSFGGQDNSFQSQFTCEMKNKSSNKLVWDSRISSLANAERWGPDQASSLHAITTLQALAVLQAELRVLQCQRTWALLFHVCHDGSRKTTFQPLCSGNGFGEMKYSFPWLFPGRSYAIPVTGSEPRANRAGNDSLRTAFDGGGGGEGTWG